MSKITLYVSYWDHLEDQERSSLDYFREDIQKVARKSLENDEACVQQAFSKFTGVKAEKYEFNERSNVIFLDLAGVCEEANLLEFCKHYDMVTICEVDRFTMGLRLQLPYKDEQGDV